MTSQTMPAGQNGKKAHLSVEALREYNRHMGHTDHSGSKKSVASLRTDRTPPSLSSLYGGTLSLRALQVTKRLSRSVYLEKAGDESNSGSENSDKCQYENSYRTEPDDGSRFCSQQVQEIIKDTLQKHLTDKEYKAIDGSRLSLMLANIIKDQVKTLSMPRYKIVAHVLIGERSKNGVLMSSRCLWDCEEDNYATAKFENSSLYAIGTVYGVYFE